MNCQGFEKEIYLYSELSVAERTVLDSHIVGCETCRKLFQEMILMRHVINGVADNRSIPVHAAKLTGAVMSRISGPDKPGKRVAPNSFFGMGIMKLSLSLVSASFVVLFGFESVRDLAQSGREMPVVATGSVILSVKVFHQKAIERRDQIQLFADCRTPFKSKQYFLECARNSMSRTGNN